MAKYAYPAVFTTEESGLVSVSFPDLENCYSSGDNIPDSLEMAADALCLVLYDMEENGEVIPEASAPQSIAIPENSFVSMVACDTLEYRKYFDNRAVKKTLTIPAWLNTIAEHSNVNFSAILQQALIQYLNVEKR